MKVIHEYLSLLDLKWWRVGAGRMKKKLKTTAKKQKKNLGRNHIYKTFRPTNGMAKW